MSLQQKVNNFITENKLVMEPGLFNDEKTSLRFSNKVLAKIIFNRFYNEDINHFNCDFCLGGNVIQSFSIDYHKCGDVLIEWEKFLVLFNAMAIITTYHLYYKINNMDVNIYNVDLSKLQGITLFLEIIESGKRSATKCHYLLKEVSNDKIIERKTLLIDLALYNKQIRKHLK